MPFWRAGWWPGLLHGCSSLQMTSGVDGKPASANGVARHVRPCPDSGRQGHVALGYDQGGLQLRGRCRVAMDDRELGSRIAYWRERRGVTQRLLADRIGRSQSWVEKVEAGTRRANRLPILLS